MSNKDKINALPILEVLGKLGYREKSHYVIQGKNIRMFDSSGKVSDGWIGDIVQNRLFCKSGVKQGRFEGDITGIIKGALNCEAGEAFKWAEEAFDIGASTFTPKSDENSIKKVWEKKGSLSEDEIEYLNSRSIKYNEHVQKKVRDTNGNAISVTIDSENGYIKAIQSRKIDEKVNKKFRYQIEKADVDADGSGIFSYFPNPNRKVCFVVEGMTDFLTLVQMGVNVIGLVSAVSGMQYLKSFHKKYQLIYIPDNDDGGRNSLDAMRKAEVKFGHYALEGNYGDLNDFWAYLKGVGLSEQDFLKELYEEAEKPLNNIALAVRKAMKNRDIGSFLTGDKVFDEATGGITPGSVMIINGLSGEGKTTTLDWIVSKLMVHQKKMAFCSIDDDIGKMLSMFLGRHFHKNWKKDILPNIEEYVKEYGTEKFDNLLLYDDMNTLEHFEDIIVNENVDVLIVDYIQVIEGLQGKDMQAKMLQAIRGLQRLSIETHTAIICLSQVSKGEDQKPVLYRTPMESQYIKSAGDTFINVGVYQGQHSIAFIKNKYGDSDYKNTQHDTYWDKKTGDISIFDSLKEEKTGEAKDKRKI